MTVEKDLPKEQKFFRRVADYLAYLAVRAVATLAEALPLQIVLGLTKFLAWLAADVLQIRRAVLEENLSHAFPKNDIQFRHQLIRQMWEHLFLLGYEILLTTRKIHETNWRNFVRLEDHRDILRVILSGRSVILVTGHFGNFEIGGYILGLLGIPPCSVARPIDNPFLDRFLARYRTASGQMIIPKKGATEQVDRLVREGRVVGFLADQSAGPKGCFVDFFGRKASAHKAVALLSLTQGVPLAVCYAVRGERPFQFTLKVAGVFDPTKPSSQIADVVSLTQWYNTLLEEAIRGRPEQYWWIHRRWKDTPPKAKSILGEEPLLGQKAA
jgi:KDO2-lipid IV(A) lauroyltransferase